ncbi:MAG: hypothetical protein COV59_04365 [Candidatus Magasanikbacteria bacterium CG11_big_fil_rev_8_21_14_0_20_39_34]|uniref:NodB homology domain-containing protein n=1 Tax=Candidatus Magasanikbacteria bacterium CG11_big_fil_rev_8_21_14_0_20_39_34 TaxID=1974653 RepID=A0A2H0N4Q0_9BACT|nr:MAG: hypothetical protein COV59_04365 [Candidatus Magasanikbacteria bacterium CG11_big_fil_rev_8_21_14_0_20_39_34]
MTKKIFLVCLLFCGCLHRGSTEYTSEDNIVSSTLAVPVDISDQVKEEKIESEFHFPILLYHHIGNPPDGVGEDTKTWYVSSENFEKALQLLNNQDYHPLVFEELLDYIKRGVLPQKSFVITFDDGAEDFYKIAFPLLQKYNMKSVMYLQSHVHSKNWLTDDQILELNASGLVEFGSHTKYHAYLTRISDEEAKKEIVESKEKIEKLLGKEVYSIAYPFGLYNENIEKMAQDAGYKVGLTLVSGSDQNMEKLLEMKRIVITNRTDLEKLFIK